MFKEQTFDAGEVSISYAEGPPSGPPLVMLHGITTWWQTFLPVAPWLMMRYHIYALDLRGHGRSSRTPGEYFIRNYAEDTVSFLREQVSEPAFLLGWSLGAMASIVAAATAPEQVRAIVLEDPPLNELVREPDEGRVAGVVEHFDVLRRVIASGDSREERLAELATVQPGDDDALLRRRLRQLDLCDPETLTFVTERKYADSNTLEELLPKINCPVLLIKTNPNNALSTEHAELSDSLLADATQVTLSDVGHNIHSAQPSMYSRIVGDFLESI